MPHDHRAAVGRRRYMPARLREVARRDPYRPVSRLEVVGAVPRGSVRPRTPLTCVGALRADPRLGELRADFGGHVVDVLAVLAKYSVWSDEPGRVRGTTRPGRARVCAELGISISTWKAARRQLAAWGYLGTVREGWTPVLRASPLVDADDANRAAVYVLAVPRDAIARHRDKRRPAPPTNYMDVTRPLTGSPRGFLGDHARGQAKPDSQERKRGRRLTAPAHSQRHVAALQAAAGHRLSDKAAMRAARPFLADERHVWTPGELRYAVEHTPDGQRHQHRHQLVRRPYAWLAWRLDRWLDADGFPVDFPASASAAIAAAELAAGRAAAERAERIAAAAELRRRRAEVAETVDAAGYAAGIRERLGWT